MSDHAQPHKRTIDERLDTLTMNLELQAGIQRDSDARLTAAMESQAAAIEALTAKQSELAGIVHETATTVQQLAATVQMFAGVMMSHESRLDALEKPKSKE